jgi:hypothetical protein
MDQMEIEIRALLAAELKGPVVKEKFGSPCTGLARKIETGFDQNPRTIAAIAVIERILTAPRGE